MHLQHIYTYLGTVLIHFFPLFSKLFRFFFPILDPFNSIPSEFGSKLLNQEKLLLKINVFNYLRIVKLCQTIIFQFGLIGFGKLLNCNFAVWFSNTAILLQLRPKMFFTYFLM